MDTIIGYKYFLRRVAGLLESGDNLTVGAASRTLNMKPEEFKQMLALMESLGDIEKHDENMNDCITRPSCCKGCGACHKSKTMILAGVSYRLTEGGKQKKMACEKASNLHKIDILDM